MKKIVALTLCLAASLCIFSQTPVSLSAQPGFTYTESFADIANWTFNTSPADGTFTAGVGATAWRGNTSNGTGTTPNPNLITTATTSFVPDVSPFNGGVHRGNQSMILLSTGTSNNTSSATMDFFLDFSGLNAGTLSFDWASVNNGTGDRKSSMRVYASINGTSWTEITTAAVLNFTNNSPTSGTVSFASLPAIFNNAATARLRFYYHNGTGGTTGSRPKLNIDNVSVTAVPSNPCITPSAQPTAFTTGTVLANSIQASFTAASPAPDKYLVLISTNSSLSALPANGTNYNIGDDIGDATVFSNSSSTSFTATGLSAATQYYFFIFSTNSLCSGGPLYQINSPLQGNATTLSGNPPCSAPSSQPISLVFGTITASSVQGSFTATTADEYIVIRTTSSTFTGTLNNGTIYYPGNLLGNGTVVSRGPLTNFIANGLAAGTTYYFFVFALNSQNCTGGPIYNSTSPLTGSAATPAVPACNTPSAQPTNLSLLANSTSINGYFTSAVNVDGYISLISTSSSLTVLPQNGTTYMAGTVIGNATVLENNASTAFIATDLTPGTTYYLFVFARASNCSGGPVYNTASPLQGSIAATPTSVLNTYYGNLHAHSAYSDGNKDNLSLTPADDFAYAKNSLCFDFMGISEHNHTGAGMSLSNWQPGVEQAAAATNASFLALYGMEWGVGNNGGHVLVYGVDQLIGWESGQYQAFVAKSNYLGTPEGNGTTGLFRFINNWGNNAFGSLCHPSFNDFSSLATIAHNNTADSALVGTAIASGPAFSTSTSYNDPPTSLTDLDYYRVLLSKGYRIGPFMDGDNHYTNFGRSNYNRLAVMAPTIGKTDFLSAMRNMRFYATEDCDTRVSLTVNNLQMGSASSNSSYPSLNVYVNDPTNVAAIPKIKIMYGVRGSNSLSVGLDSVNAKTFNFTDYNLPLNTDAYYYADITIGGARIITSPVWYTRTSGTLPVSWLSFDAAVTKENFVELKWKTAAELNNEEFIIERSADGLNFGSIGFVKAKNNAQGSSYDALDRNPFYGLNYYRLKQVNKDRSFSYSGIVSVDIRKGAKNYFQVIENPVASQLKLRVQSTAAQNATILVRDVNGKTTMKAPVNLQEGAQTKYFNVSRLAAGTYFVTMICKEQVLTSKFVKR